jgi:hypothetical protein
MYSIAAFNVSTLLNFLVGFIVIDEFLPIAAAAAAFAACDVLVQGKYFCN